MRAAERGFTPEAIQLFCERTGVTKSDGWIDMSVFEGCQREDLDPKAPRAIAAPRTPPPFKPLLPSSVMVRPDGLEYLKWPSRAGDQRFEHRSAAGAGSAAQAERAGPVKFPSPGAAWAEIKVFVITKGH